ncbi:MAG TPA: NAD(+)/NADH kinase, partial [bacterium]|nr:NAD(+)/NADH kinase [bacterium]
SLIRGSHVRHSETLKGVRETLANECIPFEMVRRDQIHHLKRVDRRYQLVISVGGDGTLLDCSHYVGKAPLMGVNSDPKRSVARFSACNLATFPSLLKAYLKGSLKPSSVARLEFSINGKKSHWPVLNDLLVTALSPAATSRYVLRVGNKAEEQMSSGVWISTAAGSTAAALSAGGKMLWVLDRKFQFVVREAYHRKFGPRRLLKGVLVPGEFLEVVSQMKDGRVFVDGPNLSVPFLMGDKLKVRLARQSLKIIGLRR